MSESARSALGITKTLPKKLPEAWKYLQEDTAMVEVLGEKFVEMYLSVKKVRIALIRELIWQRESDFVSGFSEDERKKWMIERV
jgi:glutamine synthetase